MTDSLDGKACLVTGATSGIGRVTAQTLAGLGADVLLVGRDRTRGEAAVAAIQRAGGGGGSAEFLPFDLSSLAAVRQLAEEVRRRHERLHLLVNNAGLVRAERRLTADGLEETFAVNHLAPFLLTALLRDRLLAAGSARVVTVSSGAHAMIRGLDFDNLQGERRYKPLLAYAQSKLANVLFTRELARRFAGSGVTANCVHPGVVRTGIWRENRGILRGLVALMWPFMASEKRGAQPLLHLALAPELANVSGHYFDRKKDVLPSPGGRDDAAAARLWTLSEKLTAR